MSKFYQHWKDVPKNEWHWPNFTPEEIACRGTGNILIVPEALDRLQALRNKLVVPLTINSAYRSPSHNKDVGGKPSSKHLLGIAFDIALTGQLTREKLVEEALNLGFRGIGLYDTFVHVDTRETPTRWDFRTTNKNT